MSENNENNNQANYAAANYAANYAGEYVNVENTQRKLFSTYLISGIYTPLLSYCFFSNIITHLLSSSKNMSNLLIKNKTLVCAGVLALTTSIGWHTHLYLTKKYNDKQLMESHKFAPFVVTVAAIPVGFFHGLVINPIKLLFRGLSVLDGIFLKGVDGLDRVLASSVFQKIFIS